MEQLLEILRCKGNNADQAHRGVRALFPMLDADSPQFKSLRFRLFELAH